MLPSLSAEQKSTTQRRRAARFDGCAKDERRVCRRWSAAGGRRPSPWPDAFPVCPTAPHPGRRSHGGRRPHCERQARMIAGQLASPVVVAVHGLSAILPATSVRSEMVLRRARWPAFRRHGKPGGWVAVRVPLPVVHLPAVGEECTASRVGEPGVLVRLTVMVPFRWAKPRRPPCLASSRANWRVRSLER